MPRKSYFQVYWTALDIVTVFLITILGVYGVVSLLPFFNITSDDAVFNVILGLAQGLLLLSLSFLIMKSKSPSWHFKRLFRQIKSVNFVFFGSLIFWFVATAINLVVQSMLGHFFDLTPQPQGILEFVLENVRGAYILFYALVIVVLAPLAEEIFFRGLLYTYLRAKIGKILAAICSSFLFGLAHLELWAIFPTFLAGLGFTYFFEKQRTLKAPILAHMIWNGIGFCYVLLAIFLWGGV